ncbi:Kinase suppressor of Ras 2 [Anabarilius grahami]|uniref:Kinase suppressor of Ras 2 n=1 Tax=Anabarilius grahami TaxID=495550 RepID=A0A3N0Z6W3_ANAGA|nr:Kinase suppressor of Ras 2 [Anabarilius grahami]
MDGVRVGLMMVEESDEHRDSSSSSSGGGGGAAMAALHQCELIQNMIDISISSLQGLRTKCAASNDLTQQEIRTLETGNGEGGDRFSQADQVRDVPSLLMAVSVLLSSSLDILQRIRAASLRPDEELSSWLAAIT